MTKYSSKRVAIITGGTGGIGRAVVKSFLAKGYKVALIARDKEKLKDFPECLGVVADVANFGPLNTAVRKIISKYGQVDVLVNVAGVLGTIGQFHTNPSELWEKVIKVNLFGTANMCRLVLPYMLNRHAGKIVNFAGGGAVQPFVNFSAYATSKAAVVRLTENLAKEYQKFNIQINSVSPGLINTLMLDSALKAGAKKTGAEYYQRVVKAKKQGGDNPVTAAELVVWLSEKKNKLSGKLIAAQWDGWRAFSPGKIKQINQSSLYALRRIDNIHFKEIEE